MQGSQRGERTAVEKPLRGNPKTGFTLRLEIPQTARDSHFPTATAATVVRLHPQCPDKPSESYILKWLDTTCRQESPQRFIRTVIYWRSGQPNLAPLFPFPCDVVAAGPRLHAHREAYHAI